MHWHPPGETKGSGTGQAENAAAQIGSSRANDPRPLGSLGSQRPRVRRSCGRPRSQYRARVRGASQRVSGRALWPNAPVPLSDGHSRRDSIHERAWHTARLGWLASPKRQGCRQFSDRRLRQRQQIFLAQERQFDPAFDGKHIHRQTIIPPAEAEANPGDDRGGDLCRGQTGEGGLASNQARGTLIRSCGTEPLSLHSGGCPEEASTLPSSAALTFQERTFAVSTLTSRRRARRGAAHRLPRIPHSPASQTAPRTLAGEVETTVEIVGVDTGVHRVEQKLLPVHGRSAGRRCTWRRRSSRSSAPRRHRSADGYRLSAA